jgi:hypothetical protein
MDVHQNSTRLCGQSGHSNGSERKEMNKKLAVEAVICAISFPVAVLVALEGHGKILWIYVAFVAGLGVIWILQGLFRKSN